ncbi:MAG: oxidoreductase family protein [Cellvibrionaceae bacterium]
MSIPTPSTTLITSLLSDFFKGAEVNHSDDLQALWSGYGSIARYRVDRSSAAPETTALAGASRGESFSIIVKSIHPPSDRQHPRGWNTNRSHQRKLHSYQVESQWYQHWASDCDHHSRVPHCFGMIEVSESHQCIILEDLDEHGFNQRCDKLSVEQCQPCLHWLANFHATFLRKNNNTDWPKPLWPQGSYWHLDTRPDEWQAMEESALKAAAADIDQQLESTQFTTLIHGDAKVANFCFSTDMQSVAAVDFQYVGGGCGMKDLVYFLGSCLTEQECQNKHAQLLESYFLVLKAALSKSQSSIDIVELERDWRYRYPLAWADFQRFILGWSPTHKKNHGFAQQMTQLALDQLASKP